MTEEIPGRRSPHYTNVPGYGEIKQCFSDESRYNTTFSVHETTDPNTIVIIRS